MIEPLKVPSSHEEVFAGRYQRLLAWSLQLTGNERDLAEDLLHDAFVQFTFAQPDLGAIQNLDGYFYRMLRNLHVSHLRRETHNRWQQLSVVEYDSAEDGLRTTDLRDQLHVQDELRSVCNYVCIRKETSRAASILILRFFHGYYPSEIVQFLRTSRQAVDVQLLIARREARLSFENPAALSFISSEKVVEIFPAIIARPTDDFLNGLRQMIFQSKRGACLSRKRLLDFYSVTNAAPMECSHLAHVVSCASCLDEVNRILRLPLLSERNPTETLGRDTRPKGPGGGGSNGVGGGSLGISRRRARRVFEHKPQELCVAVNGYVQASQLVNSELSELNLNIDLSEDISFVEVFSEQKLRLLLLNVDDLPPAGPGERAQHIEMSDGRTLSLKLEFRSPWPALHVAYHDPTYKEVQALLSGSASEDAPLPFRQDSAIAEQPEVTSRRFSYRDLLIRARALFGVGFWLRPATITSVVALILVAALLFARFTVAPVPTAAELLRQASDAEQVAAARTDTVQHRMITVEVSVPGAVETGSAPQLIARRHVEVWHSGEKGITARRFFDDQNNLIAGEWERGDGRTFYHHGSKPQVRSPQAAIRNFEDAWQLKLSASEFGALIPASQAKVEEQPNAYVISFSAEPANASVAPAVKQATLVLSRADLHATEMTLIIADNGQQAADNGQAANRQPAIGNRQLKKFHFRETSFERRPPSAVAPSVFVPEPELLGAETSTRRNGDVGATAASRDLAVAPSSAVATTELEIEVLDLINQSGADLGDQVSVRRTPEGQLLVQGIVQTDGRKDEVLRALAPVADNPAIKLKVQTVVEALREQAKARQSSRATTVERLESSNDRIAADDDLRRYFAAKGLSSVRLDQAVNQFAARMVDRSLQALRHAGALDRLSQRFSLEQLRTLDPKARNKWLGLLRGHAQSLEHELSALRRDLTPFLSGGGSAEGVQIDSDRDLQQAIHRLFQLCAAADQAVRSSFTISASDSSTVAIKLPQFVRSLDQAEKLARQIQSVATVDF